MASPGYAQSGIGSEIPLGQGVIGVTGREGAAIRISDMTAEFSYCRAIRQQAEGAEMAHALQAEIPCPGLAESRSQLAVPIQGYEHLIGVLYVESPLDQAYGGGWPVWFLVVVNYVQVALGIVLFCRILREVVVPPGRSADAPADQK